MSSSKPMVPPAQTAEPSWFRLIEPFRFFAFRGSGPHRSLLDRALQIRKRLYREQFGSTPLAGADDYDEEATHILACLDDIPVSSCRIISEHTALGLELAIYANTSRLSGPNRRCAEISRLAVAAEHRRVTSRSFLLLGLLKTTLAVASSQGFTDYLIWVRSPLLPMYRSLGFVEEPGLSFLHPLLGNAIHHVLRLDITQIEQTCQRPIAALYLDPLPANITILLNGTTS